MAQATNIFDTYEAVGIREDLTDILTNISPEETPMLSRFGKGGAKDTYHEWQTDSLATAAKNKTIEGTDPDPAEITATSRTGNWTQISEKVWRTTDTMENVVLAGRGSEYAYQEALKLKELARDMEYDIVNGTGNSGTSAVARELKGVLNWIQTTEETGTGTGSETLTESMYNDTLQDIWDQGGRPDVTYANGWQKRKISSFSSPSTRNISVEDGRLIANIDIYQSDFGVQQIILDRYMTSTIVAILQEDLWGLAFLYPVKHKELPDLGGGPKGMVKTEYTLVSKNEAGSGKISGLSTS